MKRKWFQIHLSTLVLLTFASAILLWRNLQPYAYDPVSDFGFSTYCGWPWPAVSYLEHTPLAKRPGLLFSNLLGDFAVACAILEALAFHCEYYLRIRNRERVTNRGFLPVHVLTTGWVLLVLGVGGYFNFFGRHLEYWYTKSEHFAGYALGFPFDCGRSGTVEHFSFKTKRELFELNYDAAITNAIVLLTAILITGVLIETLIRRREVRAE